LGNKSEKKWKQKPKEGRIRKTEKRKGKMERKGVRSEKKKPEVARDELKNWDLRKKGNMPSSESDNKKPVQGRI
jgi:hypothetical protein